MTDENENNKQDTPEFDSAQDNPDTETAEQCDIFKPTSESEEMSSPSEDKSEEMSSPSEDKPVSSIPRYDLIITSERAGYRPSKAGVGAIVRQLAFRGFANPVDEAVAETWAEIYFEPGPSSHEMFIEKSYSQPEPVFNELVFKFTEKPFFFE